MIVTWRELNELLRKVNRPEQAKALFNEEQRGQCRSKWLKRIHARYRVLRTAKEKRELNLG